MRLLNVGYNEDHFKIYVRLKSGWRDYWSSIRVSDEHPEHPGTTDKMNARQAKEIIAEIKEQNDLEFYIVKVTYAEVGVEEVE